MENGLLVGLTAQMALRRSMEIVANNIANVSTPAYRREAPLFESLLVPVEAPNRASGQAEVAFVRDYGVTRDLTQGALHQTGAPLDVAIDGRGFFTIETPQGTRFTRDGHFKLNASGQVVTADGFPVQGDGGPVTLPANASDIKIAGDGTISTPQGIAGKLRVVTFDNEAAMLKTGLNLYSAEEAPKAATAPKIAQGMVERSNVEGVVEITRMIEIMRTYQSVSESLNLQEEAVRRAVQKLGEVKA